jgi:hypothetical protein
VLLAIYVKNIILRGPVLGTLDKKRVEEDGIFCLKGKGGIFFRLCRLTNPLLFFFLFLIYNDLELERLICDTIYIHLQLSKKVYFILQWCYLLGKFIFTSALLFTVAHYRYISNITRDILGALIA